MYTRKKGKNFYAIYRKNGKEIWVKGKTAEEAIENATKPLSLCHFMHYYITNIQVKQKTKEAYKYALNSLYNAVGDISIKAISSVTLQDWITNMNKSNRTKRDYFNAVRTALKQAKKWQYIETEPWDGVILPGVKKSAGKSLSEKDVSILIRIDSSIRLHIMLACLCGLRISEICGLRKIDIEDNYINVRKQLQRVKEIKEDDIVLNVPVHGKTKLVLTAPKTATSASKIAIPNIVSKEIQNTLRNENTKDKYKTGLLLLQENGQPYEPSTVRKIFNKLLKENNLQHFRLHDLRHTTATLLLEHNVAPAIVARQLRHADVNITQNIYQHVSESLQFRASFEMDKMFTGKRHAGKTTGKTLKKDIKKAGYSDAVTCMNTDIELWSGRRDSNSRPLVPETQIRNEKPHDSWLLVLCGIEWFILQKSKIVQWYWISGKITGKK